jgi:predicted ATP-grasp superfamily ATP-dependent carboligase
MALAVVRALGEAGVPVVVLHYDPRDMAQASRYVVAEVRIPHPLHDEPGFVETLVEEARRFGGSILIPASDDSTVAISRNRDVLAQHYTVACPEWAITERFIDKSRTSVLADAHGIPAPRTLVPQSAEELGSQAMSIGFPLLLKPAESHLFYERFKRKMVRADTMAELQASYEQAVEAGLAVMLQEIIPGDDAAVVNYNAYVWDGKPLAEFTARQLRKAPPAFGSPRVAVSERIPEVIEPGRRILSAMEFHGFACTEFKQDRRDGVYKLIEVNGRHNLSGLLAVRCGINFPLMQYRHLAEGVMPRGGPYRSGIYWTDVFRDAGYSLAYVRTERHSPIDYVAPYARRHCDAIFDRHDMGPFWTRLSYLLRNAGRTAQASLGRR